MGTSPTDIPLREIQTLFNVGAVGSISDGQLLRRFAARRESAAFEALIHRHGPMVWGVCRRVLRDHHDAEEAFQATFLVLARRAESLARREPLTGWLHAVAYRTARKSRALHARRRSIERPLDAAPEPEFAPDPPSSDLIDRLDLEVNRLPENYRLPILLCELEGKTHREAADRLGWPIGTVSGRLSRARAILARRLSLSTTPLAAFLAADPASAAVPPQLISPTAQSAIVFTSGRAVAAGTVSAGVAALTREVILSMSISKLTMGLTVLILGILGTGVARWSYTSTLAASPDDPAPQALIDADLAQMQGIWSLLSSKSGSTLSLHEEVDPPLLIVSGNEFTFGSRNGPERATIDPRRSPKSIDLTPTGDSAEPLKGKAYPGIYTIEGDTLTLCLSVAPGSPRPTRFDPEGTTWVHDVYQREQPPAEGKAGLMPQVKKATPQNSPVQATQAKGGNRLPGSPFSQFGGGPDEARYSRRGQVFFVASPVGDRFSIFDAVTKKTSTVRLSGSQKSPLSVTPVVHGDVDSLHANLSSKSILAFNLAGPKVTRLYAFSFEDWKWYPQDLKEPFVGPHSLSPTMGLSVLAYTHGGYVYAFGAEAKRWDVLKLPQVDPNRAKLSANSGLLVEDPPRPMMSANSIVVESDGHVHEFTSKTGQWKHTDLRAVIDAAIKAAEEDEAK